MARFFFVGGYRTDDNLRTIFRQAAKDLGYHATARGHTLVVGSENENTLDYHIVQGVRKYLEEENGRIATIDVIYSERTVAQPFTSLVIPGLQKTACAYPRIEMGTDTHLLAHLAGLETSDATFAIGGAEGTYRAGSVAMILKKPLLAVRAFGGSGKKLYDSLRSRYDSLNDDRFAWLGRDWDPAQSAVQLVSLAEHLTSATQEAALRRRPNIEGLNPPLPQGAGLQGEGIIPNEDALLSFLDGLTSSDLARIIVRLDGAEKRLPDNASHYERVAALVNYARSTGGPGVARLVNVVRDLFPDKDLHVTREFDHR